MNRSLATPSALWHGLLERSPLYLVRSDRSDCGRVHLAGPDSDHALEGLHEDLPVADFPGARRRQDRVDGGLHERLRHRHLEAHLLAEFEHHVGAAVVLVQLALAAVPAHATDRDAGDAGAKQRRLHVGQALGANDRRDQLHVHSFTLGVKTLSGRCQAASGSGSNPPPKETSAGSLRMTAEATSGVSGYASAPISGRSSPSSSISGATRWPPTSSAVTLYAAYVMAPTATKLVTPPTSWAANCPA